MKPFCIQARASRLAVLKHFETSVIICTGQAGQLHLLVWRLAVLPSFLAVVAEVLLPQVAEIVHLAGS
jgi:hypothetical protein